MSIYVYGEICENNVFFLLMTQLKLCIKGGLESEEKFQWFKKDIPLEILEY